MMLVKIVVPCCSQQHKQGGGAHWRRHLDLKAHPERASELPEAKEWPALGDFVEAINRCSAFRTCGCAASSSFSEVPFVDIAFNEPQLRASAAVYRQLSNQIHRLDGTNIVESFAVELSTISANLPDREEISALRIWLLGARWEAADAFHAIVGVLAQQDIGEYVAIAKRERAAAAKERCLVILAATLFLLVWCGFGCGGALLAGTRFGWVACRRRIYRWIAHFSDPDCLLCVHIHKVAHEVRQRR